MLSISGILEINGLCISLQIKLEKDGIIVYFLMKEQEMLCLLVYYL